VPVRFRLEAGAGKPRHRIKKKGNTMKRLMLVTVAGAALLAGAGAAGAQTFYDDGYVYPRGPYVERNVGLQVGPVGIGVYSEPSYPAYGYYDRGLRGDHPQSTYNMRAFRSQELYPQSPPGGGY
jgi:hypothetical protein